METFMKRVVILVALAAFSVACSDDTKIKQPEQAPVEPAAPVVAPPPPPPPPPIFNKVEFDVDYVGSAMAITEQQWARISDFTREKDYLVSRVRPMNKEQYVEECLNTCKLDEGNIKVRFIQKCTAIPGFRLPALVDRMLVTIDVPTNDGSSFELQEIYDFWDDATALNSANNNMIRAWTGNSTEYGWNPTRLNMAVAEGGILKGTLGTLLSPAGGNEIELKLDVNSASQLLPDQYRSFVGSPEDCLKQTYRVDETPGEGYRQTPDMPSDEFMNRGTPAHYHTM